LIEEGLDERRRIATFGEGNGRRRIARRDDQRLVIAVGDAPTSGTVSEKRPAGS